LPHPYRAGRAHLQFPTTSWDLLGDVLRRGEQSAAALNEFADRYYAAIRAFISAIARNPADADDLTQRFFEKVVLGGPLLTRADPRKGSFRPYLKQAIRNFLVDEYRRQTRSVNSDVRPDALDDGWDGVVTDSSPGPDQALLREWARSLVAMAIQRLETTCQLNNQAQHFQLFVHRYLSGAEHPVPWRQVGEVFGIDEKIARNRAETASRRFRALLRDLIASDIGSGEDIDEELQGVMAIL
jgi:RNA polymerase sigma factor (sigma-70 family)